MYKAKLLLFAVLCMLGLGSINPDRALAADTQNSTAGVCSKNGRDRRTSFDEIMKEANDKWNALDSKQKEEIYALIEQELKIEMQLLDKLVDLGVMRENDVALMKHNMQMRLDNLRAGGEFPFIRQRSPKGSK